MANIMLNKVCNLNCSYCFANEFVNNPFEIKNINSKNNISVEDFKKAIKFIVDSGDGFVGIIGGEPTLHPQFEEIMEYIITHPSIKNITLFTNGLTLKNHIHLLHSPKMHVLVNANSPNDIGENRYKMMIDSLDAINESGLITKVGLGINMYKEDFDFEYMIDLLKRYGKPGVRTAIAVPNDLEKKDMDALGYFRAMKPRIFEFFRELEKIEVMPTYDCNMMPVCVTTPEEKKWLQSFWRLENNFPGGSRCNITDNPTCVPVIDILPNLQTVRCFGMSDDLKANIEDFDDMKELFSYFQNNLDTFSNLVHASEECKDCYYRKTGTCMGGCIAFKTKKIQKIKELINIEFDVNSIL